MSGPDRRQATAAVTAMAMLSAALSVMLCAPPAGAAELRNWFDDPFFPVSAAIAGCPQPAGPFVDEANRRVQMHRRLEKGTTCWLAGKCEQPNAYAYDAAIAVALRESFAAAPAAQSGSLWITVQGRVVYIEGCAPDPQRATAELEALARAAPQVEQVLAIVFDGHGRPPYALMEPSR